MRARMSVVAAVIGLAAFAPAAAAQNPECAPFAGQAQARNICNAAVDGTRTFHPLAGGLVSGGNPVLGRAATLGGFGHFAVTARANIGSISVPSLEFDGDDAVVEQADEILFPAPLIEAAVGVFSGLPSGLLAVDALGSAVLLPDEIDDFSVDPDATTIAGAAIGLGLGARVGIFGGAGLIPAVSLSIMRRNVPEVRYGSVAQGDDYSYSVDLAATNIRLVAGSSFGPLAVAAGIGRDKYTGDATIQFRDPQTLGVVREARLELDESRTILFADGALSLGLVALGVELGWQSGTDEALETTFEGFDPEEGMVFGSAGIRVGF
ncbi:MAG: hypothetical protein M3Y31_06360 [Gemmatimonadota bacterium]|nr:hypothetical protein [Gemmatimonadota bacterium]